MSDDLVKRLRYAADRAIGEYPEVFRVSEEIAYEAADRIEKLEAALQRANAKVEEYERKFYLGTDRIEKLEVALREVLSWVDQYSVDAAYDDHWPAIEELARNALEGKND